MDQDFASLDRYSSISRYSKRLSIVSDGWPCSPLPHTPTASGFPRSSSGQSIPIFLDAEDDDGDGTTEGSASEGEDHRDLDKTAHLSMKQLQDFDMNRLSSYSSSASSRCLSIDSFSATSDSTAPTEPPSPTPFSSQKTPPPASPPSFVIPLPLPLIAARHVRSQTHNIPLLNHRRNVPSRPGTAPSAYSSPPRQRSVSSTPISSSPHHTPRPQHSHHCVKRRSPPRSAGTISPPPDAFYAPNSPSRPSTTSTFGSVKAIPIRLVPPTPTPSERAIRVRHRPLHHAPSSPLLTTKQSRTKPLPSLPVFPTRSSPSPNSSPPSTASPAPSHGRNRSRSEGVYNVPFYPPCVYPPSPPRPTQLSPKSSPRSVLPSKFSYRNLRKGDDYARTESIPLLAMAAEPHRELPRTLEQLETSLDGARFVAGETSLQLLIDQEGFRDAKMEFVYTGEDTETGLLEFAAKRPESGLEREGWPFHYGFLQTAPHLRRLHLNGNDSIDYLRREASLTIGTKSGVYKVSSHSRVDLDLAQGGKDIEGPYFCFAYETNARLNLVGRPMKGERLLRPLVFVCSREFLNPNQGRKIGFRHLLSRTFALPTSASLVVRKQKSVSALKLGERRS